jgi:hypothetical protein
MTGGAGDLRPPHAPAPHAGALLDDEAAPSAMRADAVARWLHLTRVVLPGLAGTHRWPIRHDHCFMRVCLDLAIGAPWHQQVRRPAIRHLEDAQLARAIALAERIAADPASLAALNQESLALRGKQRG